MRKNSIKGKTVFITGASSGIGKACSEQFAMLGADVVITARREDRLKALASELSAKYQICCTPIHMDIKNYEEVEAVFKRLEAENIQIDILINNAGLGLTSDKIQEGKIGNWDTMIDTNIKGLLYVTKAALPSMLKKNEGHIINIGSAAGHGYYMSGNVYCATKHAVKALSQCIRLDLMGTLIRVSEVDPGAVETEFSEVRWNDKKKAKEFYQGFQPLVADDIADAVVYCATRPKHVNISEIIVYPQAQAALTNLYRQGDRGSDLFDIFNKK